MRTVVYATDLDRTLIYSYRFLQDKPFKGKKVLVETKDDKEISYMSESAYNQLQYINNERHDIVFIPVTTRSIEEYNRVKLGFTPKYAIVANGGVILEDGNICKEYEKYVKSYLDPLELATISLNLSEMASLEKSPRLVDGCYLFMKTNNEELFDIEVHDMIDEFPKWEFVRQRNKCYVIPRHISKQVALRWVWNKLCEPYIIASGDSLLDVPMLSLANRAFIPSHSTLLTDGVVQKCTKVHGGLNSPYQTMMYVVNFANSHN